MSTLVKGLHHVTLCPGAAQEDIDFFTGVMGQRLVKQTVLMDGSIPVYHFYYGNAAAEVGSIATTFPYSRRRGRAGSGQVSAISYAVPIGTLRFWSGHFDRAGGCTETSSRWSRLPPRRCRNKSDRPECCRPSGRSA